MLRKENNVDAIKILFSGKQK